MIPDSIWPGESPMSSVERRAVDREVLLTPEIFNRLISDSDAHFASLWREHYRAQQVANDQAFAEGLRATLEAELAAELDIELAELTKKSRSTLRQYRAEFKRFRAWVEDNNTRTPDFRSSFLPAQPELVAFHLLLQHRGSGRSYGRLRVISAAIAEAHKIAGHPDPTDNPYVRAVLRQARKGSKRKPQKPSTNKEINTNG
jgi:hypothetical protein